MPKLDQFNDTNSVNDNNFQKIISDGRNHKTMNFFGWIHQKDVTRQYGTSYELVSDIIPAEYTFENGQ